MLYTIISKPIPLTQTCIAYECDIYEQIGSNYVKERPWNIGTCSVQINKYGDFDCSVHYEKAPDDQQALMDEIKAHCIACSKVVFRTKEE